MKVRYNRQFFFDKLFHALLVVRGIIPILIRRWIIELRSEKVGENLLVNEGCLFIHTEKLRIGNNVSFGRRNFISARGGLTIGNDVLIGFDSVILTEHHIHGKGIVIRTSGFKTAPVQIGNNVLIGAKAIIMPGVTIGSNVVIGANSVVTKNIPSNSVAVGSPAKVINKIK